MTITATGAIIINKNKNKNKNNRQNNKEGKTMNDNVQEFLYSMYNVERVCD